MSRMPSGGGASVPIVNWMLGMDASGAMESLKDFSSASKESMTDFTNRAKDMFPKGSIDNMSRAFKSSLGEAVRDVLAVGNTALAVGARIEKSIGGIKFTGLKNELAEVQNLLKEGAISAELAQKKMEGIQGRNDARTQARGSLLTMGGIGLGGAFLYGRGLAQQGMAGTGNEAISSFYQQRLAREVAGIFAPLTDENTHRVAELTGWFQKLSGSQQEAIRSMSMFVGTTSALLYVLPRAGTALATAFGASAGVASMFGIGGQIASGAIGLLSSTPEGRESLTEVAKAFEPAVKALLEVVLEFRPAIALFAEGVKDFAQGTKWLIEHLPRLPTQDAATQNREREEWKQSLRDIGMSPEDIRTAERAMYPDRPEAPGAARSQVSARANGFEAPVDTWERLNSSAQVYEMQRQTADNTARTAALLEEIRNRVVGDSAGDIGRRALMAGGGAAAMVVD